MKTVNPAHWPAPKGYVNGVVAEAGRPLYLAGQVGWTPQGVFVAKDLVGQFDQCPANLLAVAGAAAGRPPGPSPMTP